MMCVQCQLLVVSRYFKKSVIVYRFDDRFFLWVYFWCFICWIGFLTMTLSKQSRHLTIRDNVFWKKWIPNKKIYICPTYHKSSTSQTRFSNNIPIVYEQHVGFTHSRILNVNYGMNYMDQCITKQALNYKIKYELRLHIGSLTTVWISDA